MPKVKYNNKNAHFFGALRKEVDQYFKDNNHKKTGNKSLFLKAAILLILTTANYLILMFLPLAAWQGILLSASLGFLLALVGFNIMHDACHNSFSPNKKINNLLGYTLNLTGGNSFMWKQKHNVIHHTYTNVDGLDDDIAKSPFIRMCQTQKWTPFHKIQHLYLIPLYALSSLFWMLWQDYSKYFTRKVYNSPLPKMNRKEHFVFWFSKLLYLFLYIVLPIILHGWLAWLIAYLTINIVLGLTTTIIFQLAHVVEETEFEYAEVGNTTIIENEWAIHQVKTTANFSIGHRFITLLSGGLNYQIEHHLFPGISHVHYPELSKIVKQKCREFNIPYLENKTFFAALSSHFKLIKSLRHRPAL